MELRVTFVKREEKRREEKRREESMATRQVAQQLPIF